MPLPPAVEVSAPVAEKLVASKGHALRALAEVRLGATAAVVIVGAGVSH